jgi:Arc/MetJ-type ribon-helix-helix transcriptional regulator
MRTTEIMTISLPPAMAKQMKKVQKEEHRTRSELLREAWRKYFESRYAVYTPTKSELAAIRRGRAAFTKGDFLPLSRLRHELDAAGNQARKKSSRKAT